ncbi:hypothetical protein FIBSPDRAFT_1041827 [Athelia psychrophila]|uniref:Uncharacterized protein n=1 Tax=Athelia psychrophila TaxID=1759441 RepID=A0A166NIR3_9AGAM|nr:hypothetical protein FIBSPDRAFT_1041827 [Fibularhizoctonia sp. CBS 109695]
MSSPMHNLKSNPQAVRWAWIAGGTLAAATLIWYNQAENARSNSTATTHATGDKNRDGGRRTA